MGRSGYLNLVVSIANVRTVIAVEMKHNTDHTVTQRLHELVGCLQCSKHLRRTWGRTSFPRIYPRSQTSLLSTFLVSLLHIDCAVIANTSVIFGPILSRVNPLLLGLAVE